MYSYCNTVDLPLTLSLAASAPWHSLHLVQCFVIFACPPWLATVQADALTGSPVVPDPPENHRWQPNARLDLASPVCFASLSFLISFYKKIHKAAVILPLTLVGSGCLHRRLIHLTGFANKNLRFLSFYSLFTFHYSLEIS